jgi:hypothetical protein
MKVRLWLVLEFTIRYGVLVELMHIISSFCLLMFTLEYANLCCTSDVDGDLPIDS